LFTDQLSISIVPNYLVIREGETAQLTAIANGINKGNFVYHWKKKGSKNLPNKLSGVNETILTIPDVIKSDEGQYYCIVTNQWNRSVKSYDVTLDVSGMLA